MEVKETFSQGTVPEDVLPSQVLCPRQRPSLWPFGLEVMHLEALELLGHRLAYVVGQPPAAQLPGAGHRPRQPQRGRQDVALRARRVGAEAARGHVPDTARAAARAAGAAEVPLELRELHLGSLSKEEILGPRAARSTQAAPTTQPLGQSSSGGRPGASRRTMRSSTHFRHVLWTSGLDFYRCFLDLYCRFLLISRLFLHPGSCL